MFIFVLIVFISLVFAMSIMLVTWILILAAAMGICRCRRIPFDDGKRLVRNSWIAAAATSLIFLYLFLRPYWVPEQKTFASPDGNYAVTVGFFDNLFSIDEYRVKIALHDIRTEQVIKEVRHNMRDIFAPVFETYNGIAWESALWIEWDQREGAHDIVRVVYPEMNTAVLLPSGTWVFPLSDLEPLDDPVQGN